MRVEIRERPYDLYAVMGVSIILMLVLLFTPKITFLRVILGLPFILFFPGYVLISALYPEKQTILTVGRNTSDENEPEIGGISGESGRKQTKYERRKARRKRREERYREKNTGEDDRDEERVKTKGLDGLERAALSLGLSIAISSLIGLILNFTYDWDPDNLGLRLVPIFGSMFLFVVITGGVAVRRRYMVPVEKRFGIVIDLSTAEDQTGADKALTVGIVIMMIISVSLLVYIVVVPREGESFTEFYILGESGKAEEYPSLIHAGSEQLVYIGIENHEHRMMNYTLVGMIRDGAENESVGSFDHILVEPDRNPSMEISVRDGENVEMDVNFTIMEIGLHRLRFYLFVDGEEYQGIHIWVRVFDEASLESVGSSGDLSFLTGFDGDPSNLLSPFGGGYREISVNYHRSAERDMDVTVRLNISQNPVYPDLIMLEMGSGPDPIILPGANLTESSGVAFSVRVNATEVYHPLLLRFPRGDHYLTVTVISPSGVGIHTVYVSGEGD
ncbi:MAG: DUF1616 domain-containing protein [Thermoplasmatota archaeon]